MEEPGNALFHQVMEHVDMGIQVVDTNGIVIYANDFFHSMLGYGKNDLIGNPFSTLFPAEGINEVDDMVSTWKAGNKRSFRVLWNRRDGEKCFFHIATGPIFNGDSSFQGAYIIVLSSRKLDEGDAILKENGFSTNLVNLCPDSIIGVNRRGTIVIFNPASESLLHYKASEIIGKKSIMEIYHPPEQARLIKKNLYSESYGKIGQLEGFETSIADKFGNVIPIRLSAALVIRDNYEIGSIGFFHDLTERKRLEKKLHELSITDSLSNLYNQRHFHAVLSQEIEKLKRYNRPLCLICIDIDSFKQLNDKLGHLEGDNVIRKMGQIMKQNLRRIDMSFRYGGDEFMVILPETVLENAFITAEKLRNEFNMQWPFQTMPDLSPSTLSIGVAEAGRDDTAETFIKRADLAMYEAKMNGGDKTVQANPHIGKDSFTLNECD